MKTIYLVLLIGLISMGCSAKGSLNYTPPTLTPVSIKAATTRHGVAEVLAATAAYAEDNGYILEPASSAKNSVSFSFGTWEPLEYVDCGIVTSKFTSKYGTKRDLTTPAAARGYQLKYVEDGQIIDENRTHKLLCTVMVTPRPEGDHTAIDINVRYSLEGSIMRKLHRRLGQTWNSRVVFMSRAPSDATPARLQCQAKGTLEKNTLAGILAMIPQTKAAALKKK